MSEAGKAFMARLRVSTPAELFYRVESGVRCWLAHQKVRRGIDPARPPRIPPADWRSLSLPELCLSPDPSVLKRILDGERFWLNWSPAEIGRFENRFRSRLSHRVPMGDAAVDIRAVWEPARLQHVTTVIAHLQAGALPEEAFPEALRKRSREERVSELRAFVCRAVLDWIDGNPFLKGPHYLSAMECGLRIPVFLYALQHIEDVGAPTAQERILETLYRHAWWISRRISLHASLGNHTICEALGLVMAGAVYRSTVEGMDWLQRGVSLLEQEIGHQILSDGGAAEQSLNYHRFVLDLYWLAVHFLEANALHSCHTWKEGLEAGESFYAAFQDTRGRVPQLGDSDDGFALAPTVHPKRNGSMTGAAPCTCFDRSGYTVLRGVHGSLLTFDHGPLGLPPLYNHGHADALSITLGVSGKPILVDPGTYRYNGEPRWRRYFKGTRAHNTVTVDGVDQAVQKTSFIWSKPYSVNLIRRTCCEEGWFVEAEHDGYTRLPQQVIHRRSILFWRGRALCIRDTFRGLGPHVYELNFHVHPEAVVAGDGPWWRIDHGSARVFIRLPVGGNIRWVNGQVEPPLGWFSEAYGLKRCCAVLQTLDHGPPERVLFVTLISWMEPLTETEIVALLDLQRKVLDGR